MRQVKGRKTSVEVLQPGSNSSGVPLTLLFITGKCYGGDLDDRQCVWEEALEASPGQVPLTPLPRFPLPALFLP